MVDLIITC